MKILKLILLVILCSDSRGFLTRIVETRQGKLRGIRSISGQNRYYGIPYAVSNRFQPPRDPPKWQGDFIAINRFRSCAQTVSFLTTGVEDCLHLDVYTPENPAPKLPVLVFIHGGAYYYGSKFHYDPEFLVLKGVIVVIINYRVGALGFLCVNGVSNLGLRDQVAALKWVRQNIAAFGGDPDNVTVSGQSAGASAAAMHMLSKKSKGLFHKVILMSGNPLAPWAFNLDPVTTTMEDARKIGHVRNEEDAFHMFMNATVKEILDNCKDVSYDTRHFKYTPCYDANYSDPFFHDTPYNTIVKGNFNKVPVLTGFTNAEGILFYGLNDDKTFKEYKEGFVERLPSVFSWCSDNDKSRIASRLKRHYFGKREIDKREIRGFVNYFSDWINFGSSSAFADLLSQHSGQPVYPYVFAYEGSRNFAKFLLGRRTGMKGASHSDDIFYVFRPAGLSMPMTISDKLFVERLTTMFKNFMLYGDPTPKKTKLLPVKWQAASPNSSQVLQLSHQLAMVDSPRRGRFYRTLCTYGQAGFVPCKSEMQCNLDT